MPGKLTEVHYKRRKLTNPHHRKLCHCKFPRFQHCSKTKQKITAVSGIIVRCEDGSAAKVSVSFEKDLKLKSLHGWK